MWTHRATGQLVRLSVVRLVVGGLPITHHGHDVRERNTGAVVLIGVKEDTETLKFICRTENRALRGALLGEPERKSITMQVAGAVNLELELNLAGIYVSFGAFRFVGAVYLPANWLQSEARGRRSILAATAGPP
jgi:hypothetical protein